MAKAKKASQKKTVATTQPNRGVKLASALFVALGVLVILSMILSSFITQTPQPIAPVPTAVPTVAATSAP